jgi:hypothetical protein
MISRLLRRRGGSMLRKRGGSILGREVAQFKDERWLNLRKRDGTMIAHLTAN